MKHTILFLTAFLFTQITFAQSVSYPDIDSKGEKDVYIKSIETTEYSTNVTFIHKNSKSSGHYILLNPPGHKDAYYIRINGAKFNLLSTQNIGNKDGITAVMPNETIEFSAKFEKIPSYTTTLDLIEGVTGTWGFYGVRINKQNATSSEAEKFRIDYDLVSLYNRHLS